MSPLLTSLVVAWLSLIAAAGVLAGYLRRTSVPVEQLADPLEDRRLALLRSLADLEEARATGALEDAEFARLRAETDARISRVLRASDARASRGPPTPASSPPSEGSVAEAQPRRVPPWVVSSLIAGIIAAMVASAMLRDAAPQTQASTAPSAQADDPLAFFEDRVRQNPDDLAARLDLAHRYLDAGRVEEALEEYAVALELDPDDAEAHAHVGMLLYLAERPEDALASVDRALQTDPSYPEALFFRGVILLRGLDRPHEAIETFERYLDAAPFGVERGTVGELIGEAKEALGDS